VTQLIGVAASWGLAIVGTFVILKLVNLVVPLRVSEEEEITGLDLALHGETAYNFLEPGMSGISSPALRESSYTPVAATGDAASGD